MIIDNNIYSKQCSMVSQGSVITTGTKRWDQCS